jgi:hypothetical protein
VTGRVVLFGRERFTAELAWTDLAPLLPGWTFRTCPPAAVADHLEGVDVVCPFGAWIDAPVLDAGTFGLVHQFGVGLEKVDIARATELGVWVARVPGDSGGNADSVAELAVMLVLVLLRRLAESVDALHGRRWESRPTGRSLAGATVAIVGLGAIGSAVAERLAPFGTRLVGVRAHPELGGLENVVGPGELAAVLGGADAVVCCAMFDGTNARMFGEAEFAAMKPGAIFVNVARGGLVDEAALLAALESGCSPLIRATSVLMQRSVMVGAERSEVGGRCVERHRCEILPGDKPARVAHRNKLADSVAVASHTQPPLRRNSRSRSSGQVLITSSGVSQPRCAVPTP